MSSVARTLLAGDPVGSRGGPSGRPVSAIAPDRAHSMASGVLRRRSSGGSMARVPHTSSTIARARSVPDALIDKSPFQCRVDPDPLSAQREVCGAPAAYPRGDTHRPARAGHEAHLQFGKLKDRVIPGQDSICERRDLNAGSDATAVERGGDAVAAAVYAHGNAAVEPGQVRRRDIVG